MNLRKKENRLLLYVLKIFLYSPRSEISPVEKVEI